jgi:ribosome-associated heat shock protein Hsp15
VSETPSQIRVDKWLWFARQTKSRSLAQKLVSGGGVRINGTKIASASKMVSLGDVLTLALARDVRVLKIIDCGKRRGPFAEAQTLYEDLSPPSIKQPRQSNAEKGLPTALARPDARERKAARKLSGKE